MAETRVLRPSPPRIVPLFSLSVFSVFPFSGFPFAPNPLTPFHADHRRTARGSAQTQRYLHSRGRRGTKKRFAATTCRNSKATSSTSICPKSTPRISSRLRQFPQAARRKILADYQRARASASRSHARPAANLRSHGSLHRLGRQQRARRRAGVRGPPPKAVGRTPPNRAHENSPRSARSLPEGTYV